MLSTGTTLRTARCIGVIPIHTALFDTFAACLSTLIQIRNIFEPTQLATGAYSPEIEASVGVR
jgi:hypothetical protein